MSIDGRLRRPCGHCGQGRRAHIGRVFGCPGGYGTTWNPEGEPDPRLIKVPPPTAAPTTWEKRVKVRELLFSFASYADWEQHAKGMYRAHGHTSESTICIDQTGMICTRANHLDEARYPVNVYSIDDPPFQPAGLTEERKPA